MGEKGSLNQSQGAVPGPDGLCEIKDPCNPIPNSSFFGSLMTSLLPIFIRSAHTKLLLCTEEMLRNVR